MAKKPKKKPEAEAEDLGFVPANDLGFVPAEPAPTPPEAFEGAAATAEGMPETQRLRALGLRPPAKDPGALRSVGSKLLQGFAKQGSDEIVGALTRAAVDPGVGWRQPDGSVRLLATEGDVYRAGRDSEREVLRGADENHPWKSRIAEFAGDVISDAALGALGAPVSSRAYSTGVGALSGLMGSDADLTPDKVTAGDAASAGLSTAVGGVLGRYAPELARRGLDRVTPPVARALRNFFERRAMQSGRRALLSGADQLARVRPPSDDAVREAIESGGIVPFGTTRGASERLNRFAEEQGANYGALLDRLEALGVRGPEAEALIGQLERRLADQDVVAAGVANPAIPRVYADTAERLRALLPQAEQEVPTAGRAFLDELLASGVPREAAEAMSRTSAAPTTQTVTDLPLGLSEEIKRALQDRVRYGLIEDTPVNEARSEVASMLRRGIEDRVEEAGVNAAPNSELDALAGAFMPVKQRLSRTLGASEAANKGAAAAAKRGGFSLTDYLWALGAGGGAGLGGGGLEGALGAGAALVGHRLLRERGPSTSAAANYGLSQLMRSAAENPQVVNREIGAALGRTYGNERLSALLDDYLNLSSEAKQEEARSAALEEALRRTRRGATP